MRKKPIFASNKIFHFFHNQTVISQKMCEFSTSNRFYRRTKGKVLYFIHFNAHYHRMINLLILFDILILSIDTFPVDPEYTYFLESIDFVIFLLYCIEAFVKIVCYGFLLYMKNPFHLCDFILIVMNIFQYSYQTYLATISLSYSFRNVMLQYTSSGPFIKTAKAFRIFEGMYYSKFFGSFSLLFKAFISSLLKMKFFLVNSVILALMVALIGKELFAYKIRIQEESLEWSPAIDL